MLNDSFKTMDRASRESRMRNIITSKARGISNENLNRIMSAIDIEKQYTVTGSSSYESFLRNAYEEDGGDRFQVRLHAIYGSMSAGMVKDGKITATPAADNMPAAFIKHIEIALHGSIFCQDSVFIYQKRPSPEHYSSL